MKNSSWRPSPRTPALRDSASAWKNVAEAQKVRAAILHRYTVLERGAGFNSTLFDIARTLVRAAEEKAKPERDRLREYTEAKRPSLELELFSTEPIYKDYETLKLADSLTWLASQLRNEPQFVQADPGRQIARRTGPTSWCTGRSSKTWTSARSFTRREQAAVAASRDPMILLARLVDPQSRAVRKLMESKVEEVERQAYAQIAKAKYAVGGKRRLSRRHVHAAPRVRHRAAATKKRENKSPSRRHSPACTSEAGNTTTGPPSTSRGGGSSERTSSTSRRRSISSARPTSSAATRAARSSTRTRKSWA